MTEAFVESRARLYDDGTSVIYAVDRFLNLTYHNSAWDRFASENGAPNLTGAGVIGQNLVTVWPDRLRAFYEHAFRTALETESVWEHQYDCSTPDLYRRFHMRVLPQGGNELIVVNSRVVETEMTGDVFAPSIEYVGRGGIITMCAHCRRTLRAASSGGEWDWVKEYVSSPPIRCSHGLCPACVAYFYPEAG